MLNNGAWGYHQLFKQGFGPLHKVTEYEDQWCLGLFLLELKKHRESLLKDNNTATQAHQQRTITNFFSPKVCVPRIEVGVCLDENAIMF